MYKNFYITAIIIFCLLSSCLTNSKSAQDWSALMGRDYSQYKGLSLFIISYDKQNNPIVYMHDYTDGYNICGYRYFTSRIEDTAILESGVRTFSDKCDISVSSKDSFLVKEFTSMNVRRLMVDKQGNIFISICFLEGFELVKLVKYNDSTNKYVNWISLGKNWVRKP